MTYGETKIHATLSILRKVITKIAGKPASPREGNQDRSNDPKNNLLRSLKTSYVAALLRTQLT